MAYDPSAGYTPAPVPRMSAAQNQSINAFMSANAGNQSAIDAAKAQYGVTDADIVNAHQSETPSNFNFAANGIGSDGMSHINPSQTANLGMGGASFGGGSYQPSTQAPQQASQGSSTSGTNPYLGQMADGITAQVQQNFLQNTMPQIRSGAQASGQYGGSRQGIAEGVAAGNAATGLSSSLANLYGSAYNTNQANDTQRIGLNNSFILGQGQNANTAQANQNSFSLGQGQNSNQSQSISNQYTLGQGQNANTAQANQNSYNLGVGGLVNTAQANQNSYNLGQGQLDVTNQGQNQNFYTAQRGQDLAQYQLGAGLAGQGVTGQLGVGQGQYSAGNTALQAPSTALQTYSNTISPYSGLNSAQTQSANYGGGATGALGGALAGTNIASKVGNLGFGVASPQTVANYTSANIGGEQIYG